MKNYDEKLLEKLLALNWNNSQKMIDHCKKSTAYVQIEDMIVGVCDSKPPITKTIWYDDERDDPGSGFDQFCLANKYNMPDELELNRTRSGHRSNLCLIVGYLNDKTSGKLCGLAYKDDDELSDCIRKVTAEELMMINSVVREAKQKYQKRLENYYKKYRSNIYSQGFWANR